MIVFVTVVDSTDEESAFLLSAVGAVELGSSTECPTLPLVGIAAKVETVVAEPVEDEEASKNAEVAAGA